MFAGVLGPGSRIGDEAEPEFARLWAPLLEFRLVVVACVEVDAGNSAGLGTGGG